MLLYRLFRVWLGQEKAQGDIAEGTDHDATVSDVEGRVVTVWEDNWDLKGEMEIEEVDHMSVNLTVDGISNDAANHQAEKDLNSAMVQHEGFAEVIDRA